jgi:hypothetical protein
MDLDAVKKKKKNETRLRRFTPVSWLKTKDVGTRIDEKQIKATE